MTEVKMRAMPTKSVEELRREIEECNTRQAELREDLRLKLGLTIALCRNKSCQRWHEIRNLTYIRTHYYVEPSGCIGGDYWVANKDGEWDCPHCKTRNRMIFQPELSGLASSFKDITEEHTR